MLLPHSKYNRFCTRRDYPILIHAGKKPPVFNTLQVDRLAATCYDKKIKFYLVPRENLVAILKQDNHPLVIGMARKFRKDLILGSGILIDQMMIVRWVLGELDDRNEFLMKNSDIIVKGLDVAGFWRLGAS